MPAWQLHVLGESTLRHESAAFTLERKTAALLTYLALEGPSSRSRLAGLFWPDTSEKAARNNLSQVTRRLRSLTGAILVTGNDLLQLTPDLEVDAAEMKLLAFSGAHADVLKYKGTLLATSDYDELSDFADWLYSERERLNELRREALLAQINLLENEGDYPEAVRLTESLISLDPVSEEAHRLSMRLHYLVGDRPAALQAYTRCKKILQRDMGVTPLPETDLLARQIEQGITLGTPAPATQRSIPLSILRPPLLVGREQELARMEAAWNGGQIILVSGPPGSGKSRLIMDFAQNKGAYLLNEGRPGDDAVPFLTSARTYRRLFTNHPDLALEPWVRTEIARLLPDLFNEQPPPIEAPEQSLRFHEAIYQVQRLMGNTFGAIIIDDLQFYDPSSFDAVIRATTLHNSERLPDEARTIIGFRTGELSEDFLMELNSMVTQGLAVHIELDSLPAQAIHEMLGSLQLDVFSEGVPPSFAPDLFRFTGGNPLFIIETLKSLAETGRLSGSLPKNLPASGRVSTLINSRLQRLTPTALHLTWAAAVAQMDFSLELASSILEKSIFDLAEPWAELERAQVFARHWFAHDLIYEAALANIPAPIRMLLHRRCATYLQMHGGAPARIALHYERAELALEAAPFLLQAAEHARSTFELVEAADFCERAAVIYEEEGRREQAFAAYDQLAVFLQDAEVGERIKTTVGKLLKLAVTASQKAQAQCRKAIYCVKLGEGEEAERAARAGLQEVASLNDIKLRSDLLNELGNAFHLQSKLTSAYEALAAALSLSEQLSAPVDVAVGLTNLGAILDNLERHHEAVEHHERAVVMFEELGDKPYQISALNNLAVSQAEQGLVHASMDTLTTALSLAEGGTGVNGLLLFSFALLGRAQADLTTYSDALDTLARAEELAKEHGGFILGTIRRLRAQVLIDLGQLEKADVELDRAAGQPNLPLQQQASMWLVRSYLSYLQGLPADDARHQAQQLVEETGRMLLMCRLKMTEALHSPPEVGLVYAQEALALVHQSEKHGVRICAETRCAQLHLTLGNLEHALRHVQAAAEFLETFHPTDFYLGEVFFTHYRALKAKNDEKAYAQLEACAAWLNNIAENHCPPQYRNSFLMSNPTNRAIMREVQRLGLELTASTD